MLPTKVRKCSHTPEVKARKRTGLIRHLKDATIVKCEGM